MVAISPEGRITDLNEATVKVTGIPREELIGTTFSDYFTEPEKAHAIYELVFTQGMTVDYPLTMRRRDGALTELLYNASVYRDSGGHARGIFAAARDVTEQKRAAEIARSLVAAEDLVRAVMGSTSLGIALTDSNGFIKVANHSLCDLLGHDEAWFLERRLSEMVHPDDVDKAARAGVRLLASANNTIAGQVRLMREDGATVWVRHLVCRSLAGWASRTCA
jgi:PAS domain S-box-containing protein